MHMAPCSSASLSMKQVPIEAEMPAMVPDASARGAELLDDEVPGRFRDVAAKGCASARGAELLDDEIPGRFRDVAAKGSTMLDAEVPGKLLQVVANGSAHAGPADGSVHAGPLANCIIKSSVSSVASLADSCTAVAAETVELASRPESLNGFSGGYRLAHHACE